MKMDIDSILYIVITLAILVISGLSSRRKKQAQMQEQAARAKQQQASGDEEYYDEDDYEPEEYQEEPVSSSSGIFKTLETAAATMTRQAGNPFEKLEQLLAEQNPLKDPEVNVPVSMEGETMEDTVDEEEQILEDIKRRRESGYTHDKPEKKAESGSENSSPSTEKKDDQGLPELFGDLDEIKKAVIYSEILNRKY